MFGIGKQQTSHVSELLSAYLDNELNADVRQRVEAHLRSCAACSQELRLLQATVQTLRALPVVPVPRSFVLQPVVQTRPAGRLSLLVLRLATAATAAALLVAVGGDILSRGYAPAAAPAPQAFRSAAAPTAAAAGGERSTAELPRQAQSDESTAAAAMATSVPPTKAPAAPTAIASQAAMGAALAAPAVGTSQTALAPATPAPAAAPAAPAPPAVKALTVITSPTTTPTYPALTDSTRAAGAAAPTPSPVPPTATTAATATAAASATPVPPTATRSAPTATAVALPATATAEPVVIAAGPSTTNVATADEQEAPLRPIEVGLAGLLAVLVVATVVAGRRQR